MKSVALAFFSNSQPVSVLQRHLEQVTEDHKGRAVLIHALQNDPEVTASVEATQLAAVIQDCFEEDEQISDRDAYIARVKETNAVVHILGSSDEAEAKAEIEAYEDAGLEMLFFEVPEQDELATANEGSEA